VFLSGHIVTADNNDETTEGGKEGSLNREPGGDECQVITITVQIDCTAAPALPADDWAA